MTDFDEVIGKVSTLDFTSNKARCLFYEIATGEQREVIEGFIEANVSALIRLGYSQSDISIEFDHVDNSTLRVLVKNGFANEQLTIKLYEPTKLMWEPKGRNLAIAAMHKLSDRKR